MTEKPVIKIEHLNLGMLRGDSEKQILKDINLEIGPQEHWAIAGESGAGKSMTMYALTSLLPEKNHPYFRENPLSGKRWKLYGHFDNAV